MAEQTLTPEQALAKATEKFRNDMKGRVTRWQPPDDTYLELITAVEALPGKYPGIVIKGQIADGDYEGKENCIGRFGDRNWGMLADACEALGGEEPTDPPAGLAFLRKKVGEYVVVEVSTNEKGYHNGNIQGLASGQANGTIPAEEGQESPAEAPPDAE